VCRKLHIWHLDLSDGSLGNFLQGYKKKYFLNEYYKKQKKFPMSLLAKANKQNKTADIKQYMKEYRQANKERILQTNKNWFYKKAKNIPQDMIDKYGRFACDVCKLQDLVKHLHDQASELDYEILDLVVTQQDGGDDAMCEDMTKEEDESESHS